MPTLLDKLIQYLQDDEWKASVSLFVTSNCHSFMEHDSRFKDSYSSNFQHEHYIIWKVCYIIVYSSIWSILCWFDFIWYNTLGVRSTVYNAPPALQHWYENMAMELIIIIYHLYTRYCSYDATQYFLLVCIQQEDSH